MKILVTGAAGFIGSHIVRELYFKDHFVVGIDDFSGVNNQWDNVFDHIDIMGNVRMHRLDCSTLAFMQDVCKQYRPDVIVHAAANAREGASQFQPHSITHRNMLAASAVLSAGIEYGCKRFVMMSSMSVYGAQIPPFDESFDKAPTDVYAVNKAAMEDITKILCDVHGCYYSIIRPHNVFGENQALFDLHRNVIGIFMNRIMREEPLFIYGDGEQTRAFSYIKDSLPCFIKVIENFDPNLPVSTTRDSVINIGGMIEITVNEVAQAVIEAMGVDKSYPITYHTDRPREVKHAYSTYELSQKLLDYKEDVGWRQGIDKMAKWAKEKGPQEWMNTDKLEIVNEYVPVPWKE